MNFFKKKPKEPRTVSLTAWFIINPGNEILTWTAAQDPLECVGGYCQKWDSDSWQRLQKQGFRVAKATILTTESKSMKTIEELETALRTCQFEGRGLYMEPPVRSFLLALLEILDYQHKVISGIQNVERQKWEAGRLHLLNNPPRNPGDGQP